MTGDINLVEDSSGLSGDGAPPVQPGDGRVTRDLVNLFVSHVTELLERKKKCNKNCWHPAKNISSRGVGIAQWIAQSLSTQLARV